MWFVIQSELFYVSVLSKKDNLQEKVPKVRCHIYATEGEI